MNHEGTAAGVIAMLVKAVEIYYLINELLKTKKLK